jgi:hypothetical protein
MWPRPPRWQGRLLNYLSGTKDWARQAGVLACVSRLFPEMITSAMIVTI